MLTFCANRVGRDHAEDVAQEVFLVVYRKLRKLPDDAVEQRPWVLGVARNKVREHLRSQNRQSRLLHVLGSVRPASDSDPGAEAAASDAGWRALQRAALRSSDDYELLIMLLEDRQRDEMASILQISETAVTSRIHRLRRVLEDQGIRASLRPDLIDRPTEGDHE